MPSHIAGVPTSNQPLVLEVDTRGKSQIFVDGRKTGEVFLRGKCPLTTTPQKNGTLECTVYVDLMGNGVSIDQARWRLTNESDFLQRARDFAISLRVGATLLERGAVRQGLYVRQPSNVNRLEDRHEISGLRQCLVKAAGQLDLDALGSGDQRRWCRSLQAARKTCKPVADYARQYTLHLIGHSHIDLAWKWRWCEALESCRETFSQQIEHMKRHDKYVFVESAPAAWEQIATKDPALFRAIQQMARTGQWEPVGGTWCEIDSNLVDGESWARHFLYSHDFLQKHFQQRFKVGWNIDAFGFHANLPQFYAQSNIHAFLTQKLRYNDTNLLAHLLFWWESPDGSRILGIHAVPDHYQEIMPVEMAQAANEFAVNTGVRDIPLLFGIGNHGGGPLPEMFERIERCSSLFIFPRIKLTGIGNYVGLLKRKYDLAKLPTHRGELYLETHRKTYTTQAEIKRLNRASELLLTNAEKLQSVARMVMPTFSSRSLEQAWKKVLFNQFHDVLAGTSIPSANQDAKQHYAYAETIATAEAERSLRTLGSQINTAPLPEGQPIVIFNPLGWSRTDVAELTLQDELHDCRVCDEHGNPVPSQVSLDGVTKKLMFLAEDVPSLGYRTYVLQPRKHNQKHASAPLKATRHFMENPFFRLELDQRSGNIKRIFDKREEREVLAPGQPGNELQLLEDKPSAYASWNLGLTGKMWSMDNADQIELIEEGPVRTVLRVRKSFMGQWKRKHYNMYCWMSPGSNYPTSFFTQDIILYAHARRIDFRLTVDWWEENSLLKVSFPLNVRSQHATFEIPFGTVRRPTHRRTASARAQFEVPAMRWADISQRDYGVALLNRNKHGYDVKDNVMRLTLLASPTSDDPNQVPDPLTDRGQHECFYSLVPHQGTWRSARIVHQGWQYNTPLIARPVPRQEGSLPTRFSCLSVSSRGLVLTAFKEALDGKGHIVRMYEPYGRTVRASLGRFTPIRRAEQCNLLEEKLASLPVKNGEVTGLEVRGRQTVSLRIT